MLEGQGGWRAIHSPAGLLPLLPISELAPRALLAACSLPAPPAPLPPALMSWGCFQTPAPSVRLQQGQRSCPKSGSPCPGNLPRIQRGQQETAIAMPTRTGTPDLMVTPSTHPPSPVCCSPTEKRNAGTELLEAAFPMGPPSQSPILLVHWEIVQTKEGKGSFWLL